MSKEFSPEEYQAWLSEQPKKMVVAKVMLKSELGNILIIKPTYKKTWQLPGGGVEAGESPEDAVIREVKEELDLNIAKQALKVAGAIHKDNGDILFLVYEYDKLVVEDTSFVLPSDEIKAYEFVEPTVVSERLPDYYTGFLNGYTSK